MAISFRTKFHGMETTMTRKPKVIDFEAEYYQWLERLRGMIGQQVPLSSAYTHGVQPILVAIERDRAILRYPNGATIINVPLRDLADDTGYWRQ
jgi:hypothetical protein